MIKSMIHILIILYPICTSSVLLKPGAMVVRILVYQVLTLFIGLQGSEIKEARRNSGGISVYIKHSLNKGVKPLKNKHTDITWIKLDHLYFHLKKTFTLHLCIYLLNILVVMSLT